MQLFWKKSEQPELNYVVLTALRRDQPIQYDKLLERIDESFPTAAFRIDHDYPIFSTIEKAKQHVEDKLRLRVIPAGSGAIVFFRASAEQVKAAILAKNPSKYIDKVIDYTEIEQANKSESGCFSFVQLFNRE